MKAISSVSYVPIPEGFGPKEYEVLRQTGAVKIRSSAVWPPRASFVYSVDGAPHYLVVYRTETEGRDIVYKIRELTSEETADLYGAKREAFIRRNLSEVRAFFSKHPELAGLRDEALSMAADL